MHQSHLYIRERQDTLKSISIRKKKKRFEQLQAIGIALILIMSLYMVGYTENEVLYAESLVQTNF